MTLDKLLGLGNALMDCDTEDALLRQAVELGREQLSFDRMGIWFKMPGLEAVKGSFGTDNAGNIVDEHSYMLNLNEGSAGYRVLLEGEQYVLGSNVDLMDGSGKVVGKGEHVVVPVYDGKVRTGFLAADNLITQSPITDDDCILLAVYAGSVGRLYTNLVQTRKLRQSEETLRVVLDGTKTVSYLADSTWGCSAIGGGVLELTGYQPEQFLSGRISWADIIHAGDVEQVFDEAGALDENECTITQTYRIKCADGAEKWVKDVKTSAHNDDGLDYVIGSVQDVTEERRNEERLRMFGKFVDLNPAAVGFANADRIITYANKAMADLLEVPVEEIVGRPISYFHSKVDAQFQEEVVVPALRNKGKYEGAMKVAKCGVEVDVYGSMFAIGGWTAAVFTDLSKVKAAELRERYGEMASVLGNLAAAAAHRVGNGLMSPMGQLNLWKESGRYPELMFKFGSIIEQLGELTSVTGELSKLARSYVRGEEEVNLQAVVGEVVGRARNKYRETSISYNGNLPVMTGNGQIVRRCLGHLIDNSVEAGAEVVVIEGSIGDGYAVISVEDNGSGMSEDKIQHVVEPFSPKPGGIPGGYHLAEVANYCRVHLGDLKIDSEEGKYTRIEMRLPVQ